MFANCMKKGIPGKPLREIMTVVSQRFWLEFLIMWFVVGEILE